MKSKGLACLDNSSDGARRIAHPPRRCSFVGGMAYAAFSAIVLFAIGRGVASTKYAVLSSFGNIPVIYMTTFDGWAHDRFGSAGMLWMEALPGIVCVALGLLAVHACEGGRRLVAPESICMKQLRNLQRPMQLNRNRLW